MKNVKRMLKISGILKGIMGVLLMKYPIYGVLLVASGIFLFYEGNEEEERIYQNRLLYFLIAIFSVLDIAGSIVLFITYDIINKKYQNSTLSPPKVVYKLDKESRKMDILLKLGVGMVFVSGILFATTSWNFMSNTLKTIFLILFGIIFIALSLFAETKLKLYRSSYLYWLLGISFFLLSTVGVLYFGIYNSYLTYHGGGKYLAYTITFLTAAGLSLVSYYKYPKKYLLYFTYLLVTISVSCAMEYIHLTSATIIAIISLVIMVLNILNRNNKNLLTFSTIMSYLLFGLVISTDFTYDIELIMVCITNIINLNYLTFIEENKDTSLINILLTYTLIGILSFGIKQIEVCSTLIFGLTISLYTLFIYGKIIPSSINTKKVDYYFYAVIMIISILSVLGDYHSIILSIVYCFMNIIISYGFLGIEKCENAKKWEPLSIFFVIFSVMKYIPEWIDSWKSTEVILYSIAISSILYCIFHIFHKNPNQKKSYEIYLIAMTILSILFNVFEKEVISSLIMVLPSLYLFFITYPKSEEKQPYKKNVLYYLLLLSTIYFPFVSYNVLDLNYYIVAGLFIITMLAIILILRDNRISKVTSFYIVLPLLTMIGKADMTYVITEILVSALGLYILVLVLLYFIKENAIRNVIAIVGLCLLLNHLFLQDVNMYIALYIGIVGLICIIIGFTNEELYPIFITGIVITVLNILNCLRGVWKYIPFWLYLLMVGIGIIVFVMYREMKRK